MTDAFDRDTVDRLLTTTRSVRRRLDLARPLDPALIDECLELALQAPNGSGTEPWRWIVVTDPAQRTRLGEIYARSSAEYLASLRAANPELDETTPTMVSSRTLWEHLGDVPAPQPRTRQALAEAIGLSQLKAHFISRQQKARGAGLVAEQGTHAIGFGVIGSGTAIGQAAQQRAVEVVAPGDLRDLQDTLACANRAFGRRAADTCVHHADVPDDTTQMPSRQHVEADDSETLG